ncbi:MAG TPA: FHA domain-containing protein [Polyangiaceae bacterium]|nr:FHA domain-containing protein [Polyangiaceae bacterium]
MRTRLHVILVVVAAFLLSFARSAGAAPEAHILRIDPRASQAEGAPVLTTVVELVQNKRMSEAIAECATMRGDSQLDCQSEKLEAPQALYSPIAPFPETAAIFTVTVDGADRPGSFVSKARWGESLAQPGIGTAWLIVIDAASSMGSRFEDAKAVAGAFIGSLTTNDIVDVMFFNDRQVVSDSKWQPSSAKAQVEGFVNALKSTYPVQGRVRPLFNIIKQAATDGFRELGNVGGKVNVPLHQAMLVLSNGTAGTDANSTGPGAGLLSQYLAKGRFPEDNTVQPKTPLPVVSVWLPSGGFDEFRANAQEFMQGLANPDIGGFYDVVRSGQGAAKGAKLVTAVRTRFNQMHIVKWKVACINPSVTQTFKLVFTNTSTPVLGDSTFKDVPMGIDPTQWPLDVNVDYTQQIAARDPLEPGGKFTVYGDFCWGGEKDRAEVYFISAGTQPPATMAGTDLEAAKRTQQQLIASGLRGRAIQSSDRDAVFEAPDKDKILSGSGKATTARLVIYDNKAHRTSGVTAPTILTLRAQEKSIPWLLVGGGAAGVVVIALLLVVVFRGGGKKRPAAGAPMPVVAAGAPYAPAPSPYGGAAPSPYGGAAPYAPVAPVPYAPPAAQPAPAFGAPGPFASPQAPAAPAAPNQEFMYGGAPPPGGYGLTMAHPQAPQAAPPSPYGQAPVGSVSRAVLSGPAGTYTVMPGVDMSIGRDAAKCHIALTEPRVSGVHATLKVEGGQLYVRDEQSNNGTFVDGHRLAPHVWTIVPAAGSLKIGPLEFSVRLE